MLELGKGRLIRRPGHSDLGVSDKFPECRSIMEDEASALSSSEKE